MIRLTARYIYIRKGMLTLELCPFQLHVLNKTITTNDNVILPNEVKL